MKHNGYKKHFMAVTNESNTLKNYASLFINRFGLKNIVQNKKFIVEVWYTNQIVGMFFKMINTHEFTQEIIFLDKQESDLEIISFLTKISSKRISDRLFVQKDVRGFESDYFYIFKPNESRLWEQAVGHLDVNDFADAILKEGSLKV